MVGVREGSSLQLLPRLRGGGGDGGSTGAESRSSFLEMYARKKPAKARCRLVFGNSPELEAVGGRKRLVPPGLAGDVAASCW